MCWPNMRFVLCQLRIYVFRKCVYLYCFNAVYVLTCIAPKISVPLGSGWAKLLLITITNKLQKMTFLDTMCALYYDIAVLYSSFT